MLLPDLRMSMSGGDHLLYNDPHSRLPLMEPIKNMYMKDETPENQNPLRMLYSVFPTKLLASERPPSSSLSYGGAVNDDVRSPGSGGTPGPLSQPPPQTLDATDPGHAHVLSSSGPTINVLSALESRCVGDCVRQHFTRNHVKK
ncbi:Homeobox protein homothorax [Eumeta japonica]|uniref:Homeobox protein homothorax n=1 Tax=Eumeta variegata TaxID=151549 RepID=A0A4C1YTN8_EUMVA|nr:Homeobox protein homothorax [Eumeta japonica]